MKEYIVPLSEEEAFYGYKDMTTELIRCKDCKYRKQYTHADWSIMLCDRIKTTMADGVKDEDFCSRAERKEE